MSRYITSTEIQKANRQQVYTLERKIYNGALSLDAIGDYLPGNVLVTDLGRMATVYMNKNGCNRLKHSIEELEEKGPLYFQQFFVPAETEIIVNTYLKMQQVQDPSKIFTFAHRAKALHEKSFKWYFASAKLMYTPGQQVSDKILLIVNEVNSTGQIANKINSVLEETDWMKKNFRKFCLLTPREKIIISMVISGKNSCQIADELQVSSLTINTHRRNINVKLETRSIAALYKFSVAFGLHK
ncbi:helix-turn-helix domain-containing protein [Flavitalea sp.]|nr:helix-turn-helix transcriptional regulator [Flavitalea sp.]